MNSRRKIRPLTRPSATLSQGARETSALSGPVRGTLSRTRARGTATQGALYGREFIINRQFRRAEVVLPGLTIGSPVAMCYIWEEKSGLISRDFKYLAICPGALWPARRPGPRW